MNKKLLALLIIALGLGGTVLAFKFGILGTEELWQMSEQGKWIMPLLLVSAVIDSINPCAFSVLLLTIAFLLSIGKLRSSILKIGGMYIVGIFFAYVAIGLGLLQALHIFDTPHFMAKVGATLLIVLGTINLLNEFFPSFPWKPRIPRAAHEKIAQLMEKTSLPAAFFLGILVGLCEFPCTGGPYLMVIGLLHDQTTYLRGAGYLLIYNLIFVLPLVVVLLMAGNEKIVEKMEKWQKEEKRNMRYIGGIIMILIGILIFFV